MQMRSGRSPAANLDAAAQADRRGQAGRRRLRADARDDQHHGGQAANSCSPRSCRRRAIASLAAFRELARKLVDPSAHRLARDQGLARQGGQPLVPDRSARRDRRALRQDPHVRRRSRQRRELSRVAQLPARRAGGAGRPAVGPARPDGLLRSALPGALPRAGGGRRIVPRHSVRLHQADRRGALARADARARDRERLLRASPPRRAASTRTAARPSAIRWWSIPGAASSPKAAPSRAS